MRRPLPHSFDQAVRVRVGVQLLLGDNFKLYSNKEITLDEAMQLVPSLK